MLVLAAALAGPVTAQETASGESATPLPTARAVRIAEPIVLDGRLTQGAWSNAVPIARFLQRDPEEGAPAGERADGGTDSL